MVYLIPVILAIFFANSYDFRKGTQGRWVCYAFLCLVLVLIAALRYRVGGDTIRYMDAFNSYPSLDRIKTSDFDREGVMPLSILFISFCKSISQNFYVLQLIHALIINVTIFYFVKKHTRFIFSTILFYIVWSYLEFNTEIIKESLAICVVLWGFDNLMKKRYVRYYLFCIIALGFHLSALIAFIFPLFYKIKFNFWGILICSVLLIIFTMVYTLLPEYFKALNFITEDAETMIRRYYEEESSMGNISTWILYLSRWIILPFLCILFVRKGRYMLSFPFVGLVLLSVILSYFTQYSFAFHRFLNYLAPFMWILLGTAMVSIPTIKTLSIFRKQSLLLIIFFSLYATVSINLIFMIPGKEDVYKYFPYTSVFNEVNVYRPEW